MVGISKPEDMLALQMDALGITYEREVKVIPGRQFRWDFKLKGTALLIEVQGGIWQKGGHSTGRGISRDCQKQTLAALYGWHVMLFTTKMIEDGEAIGYVEKYLTYSEEWT